MGATLLYQSKVQLLHAKTDAVAVAEAKVWKVPVSKEYPQGIKYSLFLVLKESGEVLVGFDNHKPKGPHFHRHGKEEGHDFANV